MPDIRPVRIEPDLYDVITELAEIDSRSITKEVNYLLRMILADRIRRLNEEKQAKKWKYYLSLSS